METVKRGGADTSLRSAEDRKRQHLEADLLKGSEGEAEEEEWLQQEENPVKQQRVVSRIFGRNFVCYMPAENSDSEESPSGRNSAASDGVCCVCVCVCVC